MGRLTLEKFRQLHRGSIICDMHYGLERLELAPELEAVDHVMLPMSDGSRFIADNLEGRMVTNKMAVVINEPFAPDDALVVYSYDDRFFGVFRIRVKATAEVA